MVIAWIRIDKAGIGAQAAVSPDDGTVIMGYNTVLTTLNIWIWYCNCTWIINAWKLYLIWFIPAYNCVQQIHTGTTLNKHPAAIIDWRYISANGDIDKTGVRVIAKHSTAFLGRCVITDQHIHQSGVRISCTAQTTAPAVITRGRIIYNFDIFQSRAGATETVYPGTAIGRIIGYDQII